MKLPRWYFKLLRGRKKICIFPTKMGGYLNGLIFLMFLLSVGYSNNLLLIFTLFLFSLNVTWVLQTYFVLRGQDLISIVVSNAHAGESFPVTMSWKEESPSQKDMNLVLKNGSRSLPISTEGLLAISKRGTTTWDYLEVVSEKPFGLYKAWTYYPVTLTIYAYPPKISNPIVPDSKSIDKEGTHQSSKAGVLDIINFGRYQGEASRLISWKHYARSGELLVKEGEDQKSSKVFFELRPPEDSEQKEFYLSVLASQIHFCEKEKIEYSLETPHGLRTTYSDCMKELSQC